MGYANMGVLTTCFSKRGKKINKKERFIGSRIGGVWIDIK